MKSWNDLSYIWMYIQKSTCKHLQLKDDYSVLSTLCMNCIFLYAYSSKKILRRYQELNHKIRIKWTLFFLALVIIRRYCPIKFRYWQFMMDCGRKVRNLTQWPIYTWTYILQEVVILPNCPAPSRRVNITRTFFIQSRRGSRNLSKGGLRRKIFKEKKMFVDTRINACTH